MSTGHFIERRACPACTSRARRELYAAPLARPPLRTYLVDFYADRGGVEFEHLEEVSFTLEECVACGLVYQRWIPGHALMLMLYEQWIDPSKALAMKKRDGRYYARLARQIEGVVARSGRAPADLELLDFGMGWGDWCRMAMAHGCTAYGFELSQTRVAHAQAAGVPVLSPEELARRRFDFINTEQVFEHLPTPLDTLRELARLLKPGGAIRISVPNGRDIKRRLAVLDWTAPKGTRNSLNPVAPLEHVNCFSPGALIAMARAAGLIEMDLPVPVDRRLARMAHGARRVARRLAPGRAWLARSTDLTFGYGLGPHTPISRSEH